MNPDQVMPWPNSPADTPNEIVGPNMHRESLENRKKAGGEEATILLLLPFFIKTSPCALVFPLSEEATQSLQGQTGMDVQDYSHPGSSVRSPELCVCVCVSVCVCVWRGGVVIFPSRLFFVDFFFPPP